MSGYFLDTSALVKRYHSEPGTTYIDTLVAEPNSRCVISRLGFVETVSALTLKVRTGEITIEQFTVARKRLVADVAERVLSVSRVLAINYEQAERLLVRYGPTERLRTLDALQLAVALDLATKGGVDHFVCADQALCEIAADARLSCINPLRPPNP